MASVLLVKPDIALFADPGPSRVVVPHLVAAPRTRRNDPCPCGSGTKAKRCCNNTRATVPAA